MAFERLTALDASFLRAERDDTPMHLGALAVFEGEPFFDERGTFRLDEVRARVAERLHLVPRMRQRVMDVPFGQGRPVWVDDDHFDIDQHVKLMVLPPPGNDAELEALCERLQMQVLDRSRPLWELWFVGGLEGGRVALIEKLHHAMVDGVGGVDIASALLDLVPDPEPLIVGGPWSPRPAPSPAELLVDTLWERFTEPLELARSVQHALGTPATLARSSADTLRALLAIAGPGSLAPPSSLNRPSVGRTRRLVPVRIPLDEVKRVSSTFGATVNDVVLAAVAGGLRALFESRGEATDERSLRVLVPVSIRATDEHGDLGNRVSSIVAPLPVDQPTPIERLLTVKATMADLKAQHVAEGTELLLESADHLPPFLLGVVGRAVHRQPFVNVVVTNIPGPATPLWFMGARMLESIPIVPLGANLSIGVAILSYDGTLTIGLHADGDRVPDVGVLADGITRSFDELLTPCRETG